MMTVLYNSVADRYVYTKSIGNVTAIISLRNKFEENTNEWVKIEAFINRQFLSRLTPEEQHHINTMRNRREFKHCQ